VTFTLKIAGATVLAATMLSTELTEKGFLSARGAVEGFNLAMMASMASGPAAAMMLPDPHPNMVCFDQLKGERCRYVE
jgi:hypothetical protein